MPRNIQQLKLLARRKRRLPVSFSSSAVTVLQEDEDQPSNVVTVLQSSATRRRSVMPMTDLQKQQATHLVDDLLHTTDAIMMTAEQHAADHHHHHHVIAFSGGIDSSLAATLVHTVHQQKRKQNTLQTSSVQAVLGISPAVPADQIDLARKVAQHIGIDLQTVYTQEGTDETYIRNEGQACWACKTHLYSTLAAIADHSHQTSKTSATVSLYNGTNADDRKDATRVGLQAARDFQVASPLQDITKDQVRLAARHMGLFHWNHAASPCLRSRLALGVEATQEHLQRIERAEGYVRRELALSPADNLRVRLLAKNRACIEVDAGEALERVQDAVEKWKCFFVDELGFGSVHARAFRSGSVSLPTSS